VLQYAAMAKRKTAQTATGRSAATASGLLRRIPSLDELLNRPRLAAFAAQANRDLLVAVTRGVLAELRGRVARRSKAASSKLETDLPRELDVERLEERIAAEVERLLEPSLRPVINATGVILHTNLGRAPIAGAAMDRIREVATQYSNLEYDLVSGARGIRDVHTSRLLAHLSGAEAAIAVNNNAAAVYLVLAALARGGEAIVSRGELIEIGDGFRIPDIMAESGAALREVGTTNRTKLADYERAISERTRLLLRVHRSNFRVVGFTAQPLLAELVALGARAGVPVYEDLGSGCLVDLAAQRIEEPVVRESLAAGVSVVSFSGDKLLGGPQCGVIAGSRELVARIRKHPMFRALRVDKLTIAALEATLLAYLLGGGVEGHAAIPALRMIRATSHEVETRADRLIEKLRAKIPAGAALFELRDAESVIGGGSTPGQLLPSRAIVVASKHWPAGQVEARLRSVSTLPVIARVEDDHVWLDLRTVFPEQEDALAEALAVALAQ
jgi:L-seryl-tRNA(Ser) seleniumtransferase